MEPDSVELGFLSIFSLITFFIFLIISKYSHKLNNGMLLDKDFSKPQAFHDQGVPRSGGIAVLISLLIFMVIYFILFSKIFYDYIFISLSLFFIGYFEDIKTSIKPNIRLMLMIASLSIIIFFIPVTVFNIDLFFLKLLLLNSKIFSTLFVLLCFLFIINGANLIDGFNGLLAINLIIINSILLYINLNNDQVLELSSSDHLQFSLFITAQIIILISFLLFNFPEAKIFLGDSGSYLLGSLIALNTITTNNLNPNMSSFFFCIILFYLFFEVFFSFLRKLYQRKSPFLPDGEHLHMLSYKMISRIFDSKKSNYINSLILNFIYFILVFPSIFYSDNNLVCKYWFFGLILIYMLFYFRLYRLTKN